MTAYLQSVLPTLKPLVARLTTAGSAKEGTAFLVDTNTALTCEHCLSESTAVAPTLTFEHWPGGETLRETTVVRDKQRDVAVLRLTIPAPEGLYYFPLATNALRGDEWASFGYPELLKPDPLPMGGIIPDEASSHFDHPRVQLRTDLADDRVNGMSGSPVVSEGRIVGIVANQPGRVDLIGEKHGTFRIVYAIPAPDVRTSAGNGLFLVDTSPFGALTLGQDRIAAGQRVGQLLAKYLGTVEKPVAFGGREEPLAALNNWLNDATAPFGLLAAPSGRGKTALLVRWAEQLRRTGRARVAFVPISLRVDTARIGDISRLLYLRLRHLVGQGGPYQGAAEGAADDIARLCAMPPRPGELPLVIILDGLDEALEWNGSPGELGIPPVPQPHIRVLMATRGDADSADRLIAERFQTWSNAQFHRFEELEYLTKDGIAAVVATLGIERGDSDRLSERLHVLTDLGDPLLLGLYLEKIRDEQRTKSFAGIIGDLENVDPGWIGYLKAWWADQQKLWGNRPLDRRVATLLGLLASAVEPLTRNDLEGASATLEERDRLDPYDFPAIKAAAQRFTLVVPGQETTTGPTPEGYTLSHPRLAPFLHAYFKSEYGLDRQRFDRALETYSWSTVFDQPLGADRLRSVYALHSLPAHFEASGKPLVKWLALLSPTWRTAKRWLAGSDDAFISDVTKAWALADQTIAAQRNDERSVALSVQVRSVLLVASFRPQRGLPPDFVVEMLRFRRWTPGAALRALVQLRAGSGAIANAFVVIRDRLSDDDLRMLSDLASPASADPRSAARLTDLNTCIQVELALRGLVHHDPVDISQLSSEGGETTGMIVRLLSAADRASAFAALRVVSGHPIKQLRTLVAVARALDAPRADTAVRALLEEALMFKDDVKPFPLWRAEVAAGLSLRETPDAVSLQQIGSLCPPFKGGTREKRLAEFSDVLVPRGLVTTSDIDALQSNYLAAKAFARAARSTGDTSYLARAEARGYLIGDSLARAALALQLLSDSDRATSPLIDTVRRLVPNEMPRALEHPVWVWEVLAHWAGGTWVDDLFTTLVSFADGHQALPEQQRSARDVLATLAESASTNSVNAIVNAALGAPDPDLLRAYATRLALKRVREIWRRAVRESDEKVRVAVAARLLSMGSSADRTKVVKWLKGLSLNERLSVMTELADDPILPDVFTALSTSDLAAIDWFSETYNARSLLALSTSMPHARATMLEGFASALTTARAAKSPYEVAAAVAEVLPYVQLSDGDVHTRIVTQGLDALSEVRREAATTGDTQLVGEGVLAAHAPPRERAAIIEHASGFKMKPETLAPWEPDNLVPSGFYGSLTTAILALNHEATRIGLFHELKSAPLRLPPTLDRDAPDAGRVEAVPQETLRTIWLTSLRDLYTERPDVCRWLTYYAPVARSLMPPGTAQRVATEIMELGDWWP